MIRVLLVLLMITVQAWAAQPTLTNIAELPGAEDTDKYITYADLTAAANESGNTARFKITILGSGTLYHRAAGSSGSWTPVTVPWFFTSAEELRWDPADNDNGPQTPCSVRANNGEGDTATDNSNADIAVFINLTPLLDLPTAQSAANKRTMLPDNRLVAVTEDDWNQFTYANLTTLTQATDADGDIITFVISAISDGTLSKSSGGAALAAGDTIASGESLWWRPSPNTYTKKGATVAADESPIAFVRLRARKTQGGSDYFSNQITLSSTIDGVDDPFPTNADITNGGTQPADVIDVVRGSYVELSAQGWIAHLPGFSNIDRKDTVSFVIDGVDATGWMSTNYLADHSLQSSYTGISSNSNSAVDGGFLRITPPATLPAGTYAVGHMLVSRTGFGATQYADIRIRVVEPTSGSSGGAGGGGGGGGCGAGAALGILLMGLGLCRRRRA